MKVKLINYIKTLTKNRFQLVFLEKDKGKGKGKNKVRKIYNLKDYIKYLQLALKFQKGINFLRIYHFHFRKRIKEAKEKINQPKKDINILLNELKQKTLFSKEKRELEIIYKYENITNLLILKEQKKEKYFLSLIQYFILTKGYKKSKILKIYENEVKKYGLNDSKIYY